MQNDPILRAALRAASRPFFLASAMHAYRGMSGQDEAGLAAYLECNRDDLAIIGLCRRPSGSAEEFRSDVARISNRFHVRVDRLAEIVRLVDALSALKLGAEAGNVESGLLAAARDQNPEPANDSEDTR